MKKSDSKIQLIFSLIMIFLIDILLTVIWFLKGIDTVAYAFIVVAILIWPISIFISFKQFKNTYVEESNTSQRAPVKLSLTIAWLISTVLIFYNYFTEGSLTWAFYPIAGITLWPVGMFIYNYLYKHINKK